MKNRTRNLFAALALLALPTLNPQLSTCYAQGNLTPPGAPAPTMKSLDQIYTQIGAVSDQRTVVNAANTPGDSGDKFIISQPGSYYLTGNITVSSGNAIAITTNNVTLDLNGFTISSTENPANAGSYGILLGSGTPVKNITIVHGFISSGVTDSSGTFSGTGFGSGIDCLVSPYNVRVSGVSISGCLNYGIDLSLSSVVESCTVKTVGLYGIIAGVVSDSTAQDIAIDGVYAEIANNCSGSTVGSSGTGVSATTANNCYGYSQGNYSEGVSAFTANNCYGFAGVNGYGIVSTTAIGCYGFSAGSSGIALEVENAAFCTGANYYGGKAILATIATGCYAEGGTEDITTKEGMP
jgi:hypothetical protein